ncbi:hypothetical protein ASG01_14325 [Chryseobacterium sp. Leaf180]|uniref:NmrA family NAD(P)-binding protein n=1 Tax=Chryseobacterium sp. Leaf180 TaxID=1736289 RepID=UPI0006F7B383|nr:NAD(P)H-binding protein [Chryseobacterium sp. Leaf180]KQR91062.1 hypothetical protein ASG01_14325 [Chryseobacterium sp. Leaf180]
MKKIAIAAATGNIGKRVAEKITAGKTTAVLLGQNLEKLKSLKLKNSVPVVADISSPEQMIAATRDVDALFLLVPPVANTESLKEWYQKVTEAGVAAVKENKIKKVVLISSLGATTAPNLGTVSYCASMEVAFDQLQASVLALRPGYFMENFLLQAEEIKTKGKFSFPYSEDHDIPFISTDDIGDAAARYLLDETWAGKWKLNLMGPENITPKEIAARLTASLNKPIRYEKQSAGNLREMFNSWGIVGTKQQELTELYAALGDPDGAYATPRTPEAKTPTTFEEFVAKKLLPLL